MNFSKNVNYTSLTPLKVKYSSGIYLVKTASETAPNLIDHFGVMIVGKYLKLLGYSDEIPLIFHLINTGPQVDWLEVFGKPEVLGKVSLTQELPAIKRLRFAFNNLNRWYFSNNCEHFARYITEGYKQSIQLQNAAVLGSLVVVAFSWLRNND